MSYRIVTKVEKNQRYDGMFCGETLQWIVTFNGNIHSKCTYLICTTDTNSGIGEDYFSQEDVHNMLKNCISFIADMKANKTSYLSVTNDDCGDTYGYLPDKQYLVKSAGQDCYMQVYIPFYDQMIEDMETFTNALCQCLSTPNV